MKKNSYFRVALIGLAVLLFLAPRGSQGQEAEWNSNRFQARREELKRLLDDFDQAASSTGYSSKMRAQARSQAALIRLRLEQGDFQVGDRIALVVANEPTLSDTLVVGPELTTKLPTGETVSLRGVLRSEAEARLLEAVRRVVKSPTVHAETFIRIAVLGAIGKQGFFVVPAEMLLSDVLMVAGGPSQTAKLTDIHIERESHRIWEGEALQTAITEGRTVDQLSLRAGDRIIVPAQASANQGGTRNWFRTVLITLPMLFGTIRLIQSW